MEVEINRIIKLQVGKKCPHCKIGAVKDFGLVFCNNCGKEPIDKLKVLKQYFK